MHKYQIVVSFETLDILNINIKKEEFYKEIVDCMRAVGLHGFGLLGACIEHDPDCQFCHLDK